MEEKGLKKSVKFMKINRNFSSETETDIEKLTKTEA